MIDIHEADANLESPDKQIRTAFSWRLVIRECLYIVALAILLV